MSQGHEICLEFIDIYRNISKLRKDIRKINNSIRKLYVRPLRFTTFEVYSIETPFPEQEINQGLQSNILDEIPISNTPLNKDQTNCPICLGEYQDEELRHLRCKHEFHKYCIDKWFEKHSNCPLCNIDLNHS